MGPQTGKTHELLRGDKYGSLLQKSRFKHVEILSTGKIHSKA